MAVKIFGKTISTPAAAAIAGGSALAIWFAYKQHKTSAASASGSAIDPVTGLPASQDSAIDPLTGMAYLAEAQEYGSVQAAEQAAAGQSAVDYSSAYGAGGGYGYGSSGATSLVPSNTVQGTTYATNAAWAQAAEAGLTDIGYASTDVAAALGRYLGNLSETSAQATIVTAALAEYGPPPVGSFTIILAPVTTPTGSGDGSGGGSGSGDGSGSGGSTPPQAGGGPITAVPGNFRVLNVNGLSISLAWSPVTVPAGQGPLRGYTVAYGQSASDLPYRQQTGPDETLTTITFDACLGAHGATKYFEVWADPANAGGPHAGPISAKTK